MNITLTSEPAPSLLAEIDAFLCDHPRGAVHQWPVWRDLNTPSGRQGYYCMAAHDDSGALVAAGLVRMNWLKRGMGLASMRRGPVVATPEQFQALMPALERQIKKLGGISLALNPSVLGQDIPAWTAAAEGLGYHRISRDLQNLPTATALVDLTPDTDDILKSFAKDCQYKIRKSKRQNLSTRPVASRAEAEALSQIMIDMAEATDMEIDSQHRFEPHYDYLTAHPERGSLLAVDWDGRLIGGSVNYIEGRIGYNLISATAPDVRKVPRAHLLMWDVMVDLKSKGATAFDMVGFPDPTLDKDASAAGREKFKTSYGPQIVQVMPIMIKPLRPLLYLITNKLRRAYRGSKYKQRLKALWHKRS